MRPGAVAAPQRALLEDELNQLRRHVAMMERSNIELKEALAEAYDPDFREAVQDNIVSIARAKARCEALEKQLAASATSSGALPPAADDVEMAPAAPLAPQQASASMTVPTALAGPSIDAAQGSTAATPHTAQTGELSDAAMEPAEDSGVWL